jgi:hypothetical protein
VIQLQAVTVTDFAFLIPSEKFVYKTRGIWNLAEPVGKDGIVGHLLESGWPQEEVIRCIKGREYMRAYGADLVPGKPLHYRDEDGKLYLNTWIAPKLTPQPGPYPRIQEVLDWLTCGDKQGELWLRTWMAYKVQNPSVVPKVATVCTTEPGGGKGTLAFLLRQMLGPENCATIKREEIENRFNSRWIGKLFVLADEVISAENQKDISQMLKILVAEDQVELEGKYRDQRAVKNRLAWMFASNDKTAPLVLDRNDRRYSVFSNHDPVPPSYADTLRSCFKIDNIPSDDFIPEMRGFYADLLAMPVDRNYVATPYENESRRRLIDANKSTHELFCEYVDEVGVNELLEHVIQHTDFHLSKTRPEWDFGAEGIATQVLYRCYFEFCKRVGGRPMKVNKFGSALHNHRPAWPYVRLKVPASERRVYCYKVRRTAELNCTKP